MKYIDHINQNITSYQYNELSDNGKLKWLAWAKKAGYGVLINPSIGHLMEFLRSELDERQDGIQIEVNPSHHCLKNEYKWCVQIGTNYIPAPAKEFADCQPIDALWEAVKEVINDA